MSFGTKIIDFYQRHLSQTAFKNKVCSFRGETCSSFGKRVTEEKGTFGAFRHVRRRLKRCGQYKLYSLGNNILAWEEGYDQFTEPTEENIDGLIEGFFLEGEKKQTVANILAGGRLVHHYVAGRPHDAIENAIEQVGVGKPFVRNGSEYKRFCQVKAAKISIPVAIIESTALFLPFEVVQAAALGYAGLAGKNVYDQYARFEMFRNMGEIRNASRS